MALDTIHTRHTRNPFAMFAPQPEGVSFENQEKGEKIILLLRAHIATLVPPALIVLGLVFLPFIAGPFFVLLRINIFDSLSPLQVFWVTIFWYVFTIGVAFYRFLFWYFNVYLVTNERIIDIDFKGLLHKEISFAQLGQIQDVSPKIIGFFGTFFHFGNVYIQTAAEKPEFEFHHVAKPEAVAHEILVQSRLEQKEAPGEIA